MSFGSTGTDDGRRCPVCVSCVVELEPFGGNHPTGPDFFFHPNSLGRKRLRIIIGMRSRLSLPFFFPLGVGDEAVQSMNVLR